MSNKYHQAKTELKEGAKKGQYSVSERTYSNVEFTPEQQAGLESLNPKLKKKKK